MRDYFEVAMLILFCSGLVISCNACLDTGLDTVEFDTLDPSLFPPIPQAVGSGGVFFFVLPVEWIPAFGPPACGLLDLML